MDKVRTILKQIWRQRFWVLSVLGTLVAAYCWMGATGQLAKDFKKNTSTIKSKFTTMSSLAGQQVLPNDEINGKDFQQAKDLSAKVREQWAELYDRQRTEVLYWPKEDVLGVEFVDHMEGRKFGEMILSEMRGNYWVYIEKRFDPLLEIVKARKQEGKGGSRGGGGGGGYGEGGGEGYGAFSQPSGLSRGGAAEEEDYLVEWLDQNNLRQKLHFPVKPSSKAIWVTQEDLWVYETLLHVIAKTNAMKGATRPDNTAIQTIVTLEVGRSASMGGKNKGKILMPTNSAGGGDGGYGGGYGEGGPEGGGGYSEGYGEDYGGGGGDPYGGREGGGYPGEGGGGPDDSMLLESRYVDAEGAPLAGDLEGLGVEFRRLPVRMVLMMNQRWIPQLMIECGNAALPVEVEQLRINPNEASAGFGGGRGGGRRSAAGRGNKLVVSDAKMVEVVLQGVVYIYNEPDSEKLAIPGDEEEQLANASDESLQR